MQRKAAQYLHEVFHTPPTLPNGDQRQPPQWFGSQGAHEGRRLPLRLHGMPELQDQTASEDQPGPHKRATPPFERLFIDTDIMSVPVWHGCKVALVIVDDYSNA